MKYDLDMSFTQVLIKAFFSSARFPVPSPMQWSDNAFWFSICWHRSMFSCGEGFVLESEHGGHCLNSWNANNSKKTRNYREGQRLGDLFLAGTPSPTAWVDKNSPSMLWEESQQAHGGTRALEASNFWIRNKPPSPVASERAKRRRCEPKMTKSRVSSYGPGIREVASTWSHSDILKTINHKASVQDPSSKSSGYRLIP